jgi:putative phosphoesterase
MPMTESSPIKPTKQLRLAEADFTGIHRIGIISDTHGLVRPETLEILRGSELIIHAGDIGGQKVLDAFKAIAPVVAVRGNNDRGEWARKLPKTEIVEIDEARILVVHILRVLDLDLTGTDCVISGHTHRASAKKKDGVLYLNPGSAGPRRFGQPATVALLQVQGRAVDAEIIHLLK